MDRQFSFFQKLGAVDDLLQNWRVFLCLTHKGKELLDILMNRQKQRLLKSEMSEKSVIKKDYIFLKTWQSTERVKQSKTPTFYRVILFIWITKLRLPISRETRDVISTRPTISQQFYQT